MQTRFVRVSLAIAASVIALHAANAQTFPAKMVSLMVPYPAGGASDFIARLIQVEYQKQLGQPVLVDNLGGVGGALGVQKVLNAPADGYSQVFGTPMEFTLAPLAMSAVKYKPEDLRLASMIVTTPIGLVIRSDIPANNIEEFIAWSKGKTLTYGSIGQGGLYHLMGAKLGMKTGMDLVHVPYKGSGAILIDIAGGRIDFSFFSLAGPVPGMIKDGRVKAIAVSSASVISAYPKLQPLSKHPLLKDFVFDIWGGIAVPKKTPDAIIERINQAATEALKSPDVRKQIEDTGSIIPAPMTLKQRDEFYASENEAYRKIVESLNLQPQ